MKNIITSLVLFVSMISFSQTKTEKLPYYEIPKYSEKYTAGTVAARQVDALGFRFYWATNGLKKRIWIINLVIQ